MGVCAPLVLFRPASRPLGLMFRASLGSGAFHPRGTSQAAEHGNRYMAGRVATAASIFFLFGQGGWAIGPALGGVIVEHLGRQGILILSALAVAVGIGVAWWMRRPPGETSHVTEAPVDGAPQRATKER